MDRNGMFNNVQRIDYDQVDRACIEETVYEKTFSDESRVVVTEDDMRD